jgi:hypothetical protein
MVGFGQTTKAIAWRVGQKILGYLNLFISHGAMSRSPVGMF